MGKGGGGGDLNLKKSWHPQTLKNIERVWHAEEKVKNEKKKMEARQKELDEERKAEERRKLQVESGLIKNRDERLTWMYQGPGQNTREIQEEFLLGRRKVDDKTLEKNPMETEKPATGANVGSDLEAKIREDPLYAIKRKEKQVIDETLNNPLKLKKLKELKEKLSDQHETKTEKGPKHYGRSGVTKAKSTSVALSEEERKAKLLQMQANAEWNKQNRDRKLKELSEKEEREATKAGKPNEEASFLRQVKKTAYDTSLTSVADRVQRNIHTIQKTEVQQSKFTER